MLNLPPASIPATHTRVVYSAMANDSYLISVALPFHYDERPDIVWPVIFVLDGNMHFNMVVDMVRFMNIRVEFCNELPDALIVGIGYPVTGTLTDMLYHVMHLRCGTSSSVAKRVAKPSCRTTFRSPRRSRPATASASCSFFAKNSSHW
jgi:hypothetical protein